MTDAIYARVSSKSQDTRSQEADLATWAKAQPGEVGWYRDKATGTTFERPGWQRLWDDVQAGRIKRIVVWRLDRLGRTAGQTITLLEDLDRRGVALVSLRDGFDSTTPAGRLMRCVLASVAAYETEVRSERQRAGIEAARAAGTAWGGRQPGTRITLTLEKEKACQRMKAEGKSVASISRLLGIARKTVYVALSRQTQTSEPGEVKPGDKVRVNSSRRVMTVVEVDGSLVRLDDASTCHVNKLTREAK